MTEPKFEVVISGIGGLFPESNNLDELKTLLFDKKNGVTSDTRRWMPGRLGTPHGVGKIRKPDHFDNVFFGINRKMAESLDALTRLSLERSIEAIVDAGINPADLSGTNTAVFMSSCVSESEFYEVFDTHHRGFALLGHNRAMQANRLSYTLNLNGPSYTTDATWIGGTQALMRAKKMIEDGVINAAIIGSCNLVLNPNISLQLEGLGRLNKSTETKSYSADANGMNRSESCVAIFVQKSTDAKRSYGTLLNATGIFGETNNLFCHYSDNLYKEVLLNAYKEARVDPASVAYVEGEGLGIKKIDAMELNILSDVFCTANRKEPLLVGSVKSNVGHCEASSSLVSLAKALIVLDTGYIPPNINYSEPNPDCPALFSGKLEVVTEKTPLKGDIIGISSFGLCNSFSHVVLRQNAKTKRNVYSKDDMFADGLPRLVFASGRNEQGVAKLMESIKSSPMDEEFAALLQNVFYKSLNAHYFRSFCIAPESGETSQEVSYLPAIVKRPIWFIFSGMGSQWNGMGKQLLTIPAFAESVRKCDAVLKPKGVDVYDILCSEDPKLFDNILNSFVGIAATQIGLVDVLRSIDVVPDGIVGHSVGELGCAYADGCFTAEQMILAAYARGRASVETELIDGMMAAIGLGYNDIKDRLPEDIEVACHNASDSSTLSGPTASVTSFVEQLKSENVFARVVNVSNIAYHSRYIKPAAPTLLKYLKEVIPESKPRSSKWVSSSIPESEWGSELAQTSSPEYHTNNLLGQVLFEEASRHIPNEAIAIEIAPHGLLQAILKRSLPSKVTNIPLTQRNNKDSVRFLLNAIGKMYNAGMSPNIEAFYPPVEYPVSRETRALHSIFPWDHSEGWTMKSMVQESLRVSGEKRFSIHLNNDSILADYKINGRYILPNSVLLLNLWKSFITIQNELDFNGLVGFRELQFLKNVEIIMNDTLEFYSFIQCGTGYFEVCMGTEVIAKGIVFRPDPMDMAPIYPKMKYPPSVGDSPYSSISKHDLYALLEHNGYKLGEVFKTITNIDLHFEEYRGNVRWTDNWMCFLNAVFTFLIHKSMENNDNPTDISTIRQLIIDPSKFQDCVGKDTPIYYNFNTNEINGEGIYVLHPEVKPVSMGAALNSFELRFEEERYVELDDPNFKNEINFINSCVQLIFEFKKYQSNVNVSKFNIFYCGDKTTISEYIAVVKQIIDTQTGIQHEVASFDDFYSEEITFKKHIIVLVSKDRMRFIVSELKNTKHNYLLVSSDSPLNSDQEWSVIMQQEFDGGRHLALIKKVVKKEIISLQVENVADLQKVHDDIKTSLSECKKTKRYLCIVTKAVAYAKLTRFVEEILDRHKSKIIRFVFYLDGTGRPELVDTVHAEQLRKQLLINIYKDGRWGTIVRYIVGDSTLNASPDNDSTSQIDSLTLDGLKVKYLGINFKDMTVNNDADNELGHLEYSGVTADGKMVMGIAPFEKNTSKKITPDPYLSWIIPSDWSLEDAATVPLSYSMAYYMFTVLTTPDDKFFENSVLVHAGFNIVGQAAIAIALSAGNIVYATVENQEQSELLRKRFPSLPESRILNYKIDNFEVRLKLATKGTGISTILNCLEGSDFHASLRTLAPRGKFFQLTKSDMKKKDKLGMLFFLNNVGFYGVNPDGLLAASAEAKLKVQNHVQKGIEMGVVKPLERRVLTGPCTGEQAIKSLKLSSQGIESKRVVLALEREKTPEKAPNNSKYEKYQCSPNRVYIIFGSKYSTWIDLVEWLVVRGARKIVVSMKKYSMSTTASRRFNILMARYQNIMIQIVSDSNLNSKEELIQLFKDTTATNALGGVFFTTLSDEKDKIRNIQHALVTLPSLRESKPLFACIMSGGDEICAELRASGVCPNAVSVSWSSMATDPKFSNLLPSLDKILINFDNISSSTIICSEYNKEITVSREVYSKMIALLPESVDELSAFGDVISDECDFVEVHTNSLRFADSIATVPVFVVTSFRPERMKKLYENLIYPTFEARLPETIDSLEDVAAKLVQKLKTITKCGNVSLLGESWGGTVCILMAQILEAENIAVSLTLLEGIPNVLRDWTRSLMHFGNVNAKLVFNYFQVDEALAKGLASKHGWATELPVLLSSNNVPDVDKTFKALNAIRSRLNALFTVKSLPNRIISKVKVINRTINHEKSNVHSLLEHCVHVPGMSTMDETDYDRLLSDKRLAQIVNRNILHYHPDGKDVPIADMYARIDSEVTGCSDIVL